MARTYNRKTADNTSKYVKASQVFIAEKSGAVFGTPVRYEALKNSKIVQEEEEFSEKDDSGQTVVFDTTVTGVNVSGLILTRDEQVRKQFSATGDQTFKDKLFCVWMLGAEVVNNAGVTKREMWIFPSVRFTQAFSYEIGGEGKFDYKFIALKNATGAAVDLPLPSGLTGAGGWSPATTGAITGAWATDEFYYTADIA